MYIHMINSIHFMSLVFISSLYGTVGIHVHTYKIDNDVSKPLCKWVREERNKEEKRKNGNI